MNSQGSSGPAEWSQYPIPVSSEPDMFSQHPIPVPPATDPEAASAEHQNVYKELAPGADRNGEGMEAVEAKGHGSGLGTPAGTSLPTTPAPAYQPSSAAAQDEKKTNQKILGMSRRNFIIAASLLAVVIIAAVLGGVLGTQLGEDSSPPEETPVEPVAPPPPTEAAISDMSRLSASNWTATDGTLHRTVYFQDEFDSLIARRWDSRNESWTTANITGNWEGVSGVQRPASGTSLAAVASDFYPDSRSERVFYLDGDNYIRGFTATWEGSDEPATGQFQPWLEVNDWNRVAWPGSELAATYQYHNTADQGGESLILAYQYLDGTLWVGNDTAWDAPREEFPYSENSPALVADMAVGPPTPFVLGPFWAGKGGNLQLTWQTNGYNGLSDLDLKGWSNDNNPTWKVSEYPSMENVEFPESLLKQHLAFTKFENVGQSMLLLRQNDGTISVNYNNGERGYVYDELIFQGYSEDPAPQWGPIATAHGGYFYGISDGKVLEYVLSNPSDSVAVFDFVSVVYP